MKVVRRAMSGNFEWIRARSSWNSSREPATIHRFEQISIDMLERNIEIVADVFMRHHDIEQLFINMFGLNVEHAKPGGRKRRRETVEQPSKTTLWLKIAPPDAGILVR